MTLFNKDNLPPEVLDRILTTTLKCLSQFVVSVQIASLDGTEEDQQDIKEFCTLTFDHLFSTAIQNPPQDWGWEVFEKLSKSNAPSPKDQTQELIQYTTFEIGGIRADAEGHLAPNWTLTQRLDHTLIFSCNQENIIISASQIKSLMSAFPFVSNVTFDSSNKSLTISLA